MRTFSHATAALLAVLVSAGEAGAAPWKPKSNAARVLISEGNDAFKQKDYERAAALFEAAWAKEPALLAAFNAAQALRAAGKWKRAINFYDLILADGSISTVERGDVESRRRVAEWFLLAETNAAAGQLAEARDYYRKLLGVKELGEIDRERVTLAIEDLARRQATDAAQAAAAAVDAPGNQPPAEPVAAPLPDDAPTARSSGMPTQRKIALAVGATGLISIGAGLVFGVRAAGLEDDAARLCPSEMCDDAAEANALLEEGDRNALYANIGYGVGAAAVVGSVVLWFTGGESPETRAPRQAVTPRLSPTFAGLDVTVRF